MAAPTSTRRPPADRARSNGSGPTPATDGTRAFAGRSSGRKVKVPELAIGLLVTVGFALGAVVWQLRSTERVQAVVVASSIDRGDTITARDLRVAYVSDSDGVVRTGEGTGREGRAGCSGRTHDKVSSVHTIVETPDGQITIYRLLHTIAKPGPAWLQLWSTPLSRGFHYTVVL